MGKPERDEDNRAIARAKYYQHNRPEVCYGPAPHQHAKGCHPARPLCRWMRRVQPQRQMCDCGAYHFPHRRGSGACGDPMKAERYYFKGDPQLEAYDDGELSHCNEGSLEGDTSFNPEDWEDE